MQVTLLHYDADALDLLLFSKQTRLTFDADSYEAVKAWPEERKQAELDYMLGTIQSSWEFPDYVFVISGVSRAFTHQFVRTRQGSYAQQSQRTVDMTDFDFITPTALTPAQVEMYDLTMNEIADGYFWLLNHGAAPQDARGVLPTNVSTAIMAKFNLRTLADMAKTRLCTRTQGEYQDVFREMRRLVIEVHPWAEPFIRVACAATGVCQFPNYKECPIKPGIFNPDTGYRWDGEDERTRSRPLTRAEIQDLWEHTRFEAIPQHKTK